MLQRFCLTDDMNRVISAISFAADKHRNQRRKDIEASPYINHPIALANSLANEAGIEDEEVLVSATLARPAPSSRFGQTSNKATNIRQIVYNGLCS